MNRLLLFATAASVALTGAAFAQTNSTTTTTPKPAASATAPAQPSPSASSKSTAMAPTAPAQGSIAQPESTKPAPKTAMGKDTAMKPVKSAHKERMRRHGAMKPTMTAQRLVDRETQALNVLEAKGYGGNYTDFQRDGSNYSAMVMHHGKQQKVTIDPDTGTVTP